jgi:hypothetical protein
VREALGSSGRRPERTSAKSDRPLRRNATDRFGSTRASHLAPTRTYAGMSGIGDRIRQQ